MLIVVRSLLLSFTLLVRMLTLSTHQKCGARVGGDFPKTQRPGEIQRQCKSVVDFWWDFPLKIGSLVWVGNPSDPCLKQYHLSYTPSTVTHQV